MIWRGFDKDDVELELGAGDIAARYPDRSYSEHWAIHGADGARLATAAFADDPGCWPDVAALFKK